MPFWRYRVAGLSLLLVLAGCHPEHSDDAGALDRLTSFRVRADAAVDLNALDAWAAKENETAIVQADVPFRLRLEVAHAGTEQMRRYRLQVRRNDGEWRPLPAENFPQPGKALMLDFNDLPEAGLDRLWQTVQGAGHRLHWKQGEDSGYVRVRAAETPVLALARYQLPWQPVEFAAMLRFPGEEASRAGLLFGYVDADNYHRVDIEAGRGVTLVRVRDGQAEPLATKAFDVLRDRWTELKLVLRGTEITVEYDDEALVLRHRLDAVAHPRTGVYVGPGGVVDVSAIAIEGMPRTPRVSIIEAGAFDHGDATVDLLKTSEQPFAGGAGVSFDEWTPSLALASGHSEWAFPLVIRRFADAAAMNDTGDRFAFRVIGEDGTVLSSTQLPTVVLRVPDGHLGGTFVETPMRLGPWQADSGALYFLMEPAETDNMLMTVRSIDGGDSWVEVDGINRPATGDLEGFASRQVGDRIHMLHQTSDHVFYHAFNTADHPERPDTWAVRDERLASPVEPPTQVADLAVRADGSVVAVYGGPAKIHYRIRSPEGQWSAETVVDADRGPDLSGPSLVRDRDDVVHLAYTGDDGTAWYRQLRPDGTLTPRQRVAIGLGTDSEDVGSVLPLVYLPEQDAVSILYRRASGHLWERRVGADDALSAPVQVSDRAVAQNTVDSDQTGADAVGHGGSVHVLFVEQGSGALLHVRRDGDAPWSAAEPVVDDAKVQWVRGNVLATDDGPVYGFVYDAGSDGGSGMNRFGRIALDAR